jgi:transcriptional regulator with XRE-family HTH domain
LSEFARLIERGLSKPRLDVADDIAEALEISFSQLIAEAEPKRRASCA